MVSSKNFKKISMKNQHSCIFEILIKTISFISWLSIGCILKFVSNYWTTWIFFIILLYIFIGIRTFILSFSVLVQFYIKYFLAFQARLVFFSSFFTITDNYCFQWNGYHFWLFVIKLFLNYECKIYKPNKIAFNFGV